MREQKTERIKKTERIENNGDTDKKRREKRRRESFI